MTAIPERTSVYLSGPRSEAIAASGRTLLEVLDLGLAAIDAGQAPVRLVPLGQRDADGKPVWVYFIERGDGSEGCPVTFCGSSTVSGGDLTLAEFNPLDEVWLSIDGGHCGDCRADEEAAAAVAAEQAPAQPAADPAAAAEPEPAAQAARPYAALAGVRMALGDDGSYRVVS